jgi:alpha-D-xyloside xylohydrolase
MATIEFDRVEDYEIAHDQLILSCSVNSSVVHRRGEVDTNLRVVFTFYSDEIVNIYSSPTKSRDDYSPNLALDYDTVSSSVELDDEVTDNTLCVSTSALRLSVDLDDVGFQIDSNEEILRTPERVTNVRGENISKPMGFTEERIQNWPLKVTQSHITFQLGPRERIYGCGERFGQVEHTGERFTARVEQASGTMSDRTYKSVPFYLSDKGVGVFAETTNDVSYDFGASAVNATEITVDDDVLSITIFSGSDLKSVLKQYTAVTGRPPRLPKWTHGLWMSKNSYESADEVIRIASKLRDLSIPCDVIHIDPQWMDIDSGVSLLWDEEKFPDPESFLSTLADEGFKTSVWEYPYLKRGSRLFKQAEKEGYFVTDEDGDPYLLRQPSSPSLPYTQFGIVDFTDDGAREWWRLHHEYLLEMGVDAFKLDFGEYVPDDCVTSSGQTGKAIHNVYPTLYADTVADAFDSTTTEHTPVLWVRAGWAGTQRYPVHWGGDTGSTFDALAASIRGGLSLSLSGYPFWSCDAGGYVDEPSETLYVRWLQWALMGLSHVRLHGQQPREPWQFGKTAVQVAQKFGEERYRLMPYIYSYAEQAHRTGLPLMRPLFLEYPDFRDTKGANTQHLLGECIMVVPVLDTSGDVEIEFPDGQWIDYWTGEYFEGPATHRRTVELTELPVYVAAGSVVPKREPTHSLTAGTPGTLEFVVYPERAAETDATFPFYHEETDSIQEMGVNLSPSHTELGIELDEPELFAGTTITIRNPSSELASARLNSEVISESKIVRREDDVVIEIEI